VTRRTRHRAVVVIVALLAFAVVSVASAALTSPVERKIAAAVDRHAPAAHELLRRVVEINSGTMNPDGVREVGRVFAAEFEALGFKTRWADGAAWGRAGHLVATRPKQGPRVLLIGHLDTVFEKDSPFQRFEPLSDSTARGPGICDMKGGDVIMLLALRALKEAGALDRLSVTAVLTGDEEKSGDPLGLARADLIAAAEEAEVAIGFEDGDGKPQHAVISRRGTSSWVLRVGGTAAHLSQIFRPDIGSGSVYEAARILTAFKDSLSVEPYLTVNPGALVGGTSVTLDPEASRGTAFGKTNVIAESTLVIGDLRTLSIDQRESAKAIMRRIVEASPPHAGAAITFTDGYPPLAPSDGNRKLLAIYDKASRDLGVGPVEAVDPSRAGAADVSFCEGHVEMAIDGVGMRGDFGHTVQETADLRWLPWQAKRAALVLARLVSPAPVRRRR
jgi:glutamate carboxypeptidase